MKTYFAILLIMSFAAFVACGPSEEEIRKIKSDEDSMSKIDGSKAIDFANKILSDTAPAESDSAEKLDTKAKK